MVENGNRTNSPLSEIALQQLQSLADRLKDEIQHAEAQQRGVEQKLQDQREDLAAVVRTLSRHGQPKDEGTRLAIVPENLDPSDVAGLNLRDAVRKVFSHFDDAALRPADVTNALKDAGYESPGKTALGLRVSNDMWKLARRGELAKTGNGRYRINDSATQED